VSSSVEESCRWPVSPSDPQGHRAGAHVWLPSRLAAVAMSIDAQKFFGARPAVVVMVVAAATSVCLRRAPLGRVGAPLDGATKRRKPRPPAAGD
jgi:hypothetical protein